MILNDFIYAKDEFDYVYYRKYRGGLHDVWASTHFGSDVHMYDNDSFNLVKLERKDGD